MHETLVASSMVSLYDPVCMLDISKEVAAGYLILLLGGPESPSLQTKRRRSKRDRSLVSVTPEIDKGVVSLAFLALTDGNVLNACFGAPMQLCVGPSPAYQMAKNAKRALVDAADSSDAVRPLAVETYAKGFRIVIDYNDQLAELNPCSRCCKQSRIHQAAVNDLAVAFRTLSEAISAAT